jgi:hypothetical protein
MELQIKQLQEKLFKQKEYYESIIKEKDDIIKQLRKTDITSISNEEWLLYLKPYDRNMLYSGPVAVGEYVGRIIKEHNISYTITDKSRCKGQYILNNQQVPDFSCSKLIQIIQPIIHTLTQSVYDIQDEDTKVIVKKTFNQNLRLQTKYRQVCAGLLIGLN